MDNPLEKSIVLPEQIFEQSVRRVRRRLPALRWNAAGRSRWLSLCLNRRSSGFDVAAEPPLGRNILDLAHRKPDLPGRHPRTQGLVGCPSADSRQDQGTAEDPGIPCPEFVVHEPPKVTDSHPSSLSRHGRTLEWLP